jgi:site-specific DNA-methyltransferase (adenine-specific)
MSWKEPFPKENRYFETENGILYNQDVIEIIKKFPKESIDLVVTSPPYVDLRYYGKNNKKEFEKIWNFEKFKILAKELFRILKKGGVVVWVVGDKVINGSETGEPFKQVLFFKEEVGFNLHDTMIYKKRGIRFPEKTRYYQCFEFMFVLSKGKPKTVNLIQDRPNSTYGRVQYYSSERSEKGDLIKRRIEKKIKKYSVRFNIWEYKAGWYHSTSDKIAFNHPAIFPEQLAHDHIISWSKEGDLVFDPLCGSGTTLKMAEKLGRRWIGIEINPEYCEIAKQRILKIIEEEK